MDVPTTPPEQIASGVDPDALRRDILQHLEALGLPAGDFQFNGANKPTVRASHALQREQVFLRESAMLGDRAKLLFDRFAEGAEVDPARVQPTLVPVVAGSGEGDLFRLATLLWSVPVSRGYGRRMRFLVMDQQNDKLIGILALGDPVFNLRARDAWIGWSVEQRKRRLVDLMDAFILGAVPPYSQLLGGKLIASLIGSAEVGDAFREKYGGTTGIISGAAKDAQLVLVTVTSALGRSSLYNRLVLRDQPGDPTSKVLVHLDKIGATAGYGHFQLSDELFGRLRLLLRQRNHPYVSNHGYGQGPNWRMRVIRVGLEVLALDPDVLRHGIAREVYAMPLAENTRAYLAGRDPQPKLDRPTIDTIAEAARQRWIIPRALRMPEYRTFKRSELPTLLASQQEGADAARPVHRAEVSTVLSAAVTQPVDIPSPRPVSRG